MKVISARNHGYLDFLTVGIFILAPLFLDFSPIPTMLAYVLAGVHLMVTLTSDFSLGAFKVLAFTLHGWIERIVGPTLVVVPFILGFADELTARNFYMGVGAIIIIVGLLTNYHEVRHGAEK